MKERVTIIGGGLAGCEAAWQLANRNIQVILYEMRPEVFSPAHRSKNLAELVCSNSLRSDRLENAVGLLKQEMRLLDSLIIKSADINRVPAGGALAVDRSEFSRYITEQIENHKNIKIIRKHMNYIPEGPVIIATGPLSSYAISQAISDLIKEDYLYFYDAAAPIVDSSSLDLGKIFRASRYGRGEDYLNCPMSEEEYKRFWRELVNAKTVELKYFEHQNIFEGCIPIEVMAKRGIDTLRYGPLKPVGLIDPITGKEPYAVVQLRQDDRQATMYNLVGFQTNLKFPEQKRVFSLIPGLENSTFIRYGVMHRNTFINSPAVLNKYYQLEIDPRIFFAGQITGVEGYVESASSGLVAGINMSHYVLGKPLVDFSNETAIGALAHYISDRNIKNFQPMNVNFGIIAPLDRKIRNKQQRNLEISKRALNKIDNIKASKIVKYG
ncbi:MAG TPA: methylenetetrahydrofolate--tRNA-(uracil(54)-C(5))-methyltransferase (FADH(2)-oxidizing) TrmFO [Clostridiales bacterium]|nr:methylenetetrahydrofolate--tRNA-(uracil(54)-C(5))-methyltransferase (FADH(2)-oxidizing) TrmFO [Clostridiales bacterium]